ncbi:hypothetical protein [Polymorphospora lycopeni]|uniref:Secreted protein n=1 Tax=Polymorphospora lycopeni TaxID=3140240 RepID=A0ABV5CKE5_9ACTN
MAADRTLPTLHFHRLRTVLLALGLALGLAAPTLVATPASAQPTTQARDPLCWADGFSEPPGIGRPLALTWSRIGNRSNGGYTYRYWMVQEVSATSNLYYQRSLVARCSGDSLVSTTTITATDGTGTQACTSPGDIHLPVGSTERFVGQRVAYVRSSLVFTYTFRYWHREALSIATLQWFYQSSGVVMC